MKFLPLRSIISLLVMFLFIGTTASSSIVDSMPKVIKTSGILSDMKVLTIPKYSGGPAVALSPGGKYLAVTGDRSKLLVIFDVEKEKVIKKIPRKENRIDGDRLVFSPDGKYLAVDRIVWPRTDGPKQPVVTILDGETFEIIRTVGENCCGSRFFTFSPDSKYLLIDGPVRNHAIKTFDLIDTKTWKSVHQVLNEPGTEALEFTRDGKYIIDLYNDRENYNVLKPANGTRKFISYDTNLRVWDAKNMKLVRTVQRIVTGGVSRASIAVADDGNVTLTSSRYRPEWIIRKDKGKIDSWVDIVNIHSGKRVRKIDDMEVGGSLLSYSANSKYLVSISRNNDENIDQIKVYTADFDMLLEQIDIIQTPFATRSSMSSDGSRIAFYWANKVFVWKINTEPVEQN